MNERAREVLAAIEDFIDVYGYSPTQTEIGLLVGIHQTAVSGYMRALEDKGLLVRKAGQVRTVRVRVKRG